MKRILDLLHQGQAVRQAGDRVGLSTKPCRRGCARFGSRSSTAASPTSACPGSQAPSPPAQGLRCRRDAALDRGWLLGYSKDASGPRHNADVEIKWGVHPQGDERAQWARGEERTALLVLISGRFRVELPGRSVLLAEQGDYVVRARASITPGSRKRSPRF